jgi:hypothetical protein
MTMTIGTISLRCKSSSKAWLGRGTVKPVKDGDFILNAAVTNKSLSTRSRRSNFSDSNDVFLSDFHAH